MSRFSVFRCFLILTAGGPLADLTSIAAETAAGAVTRPAISGLAGVAFYARDLALSRSYYRDFLGYAERPAEHAAMAGPQMTWFKINDHQQLELRVGPPAGLDRLQRVGLLTSDAEGLRRYLHAKGYPVPAAVERGLYGDRSFTVRDPDGRLIEFIERTSASWSTNLRGQALPATRIAARIRHAGFMVADLATSLTFYQDILGFTEFWRGSADEKTLSWVNLKVPDGDEYLELMLYDPASPPNADRMGSMNHICLEVEDVAGSEKLLRTRPLPAPCKAMSALRIGRNGKRQVNAYDPDGTRTEMMEPGTHDGRPVPSSTAPLPAAAR